MGNGLPEQLSARVGHCTTATTAIVIRSTGTRRRRRSVQVRIRTDNLQISGVITTQCYYRQMACYLLTPRQHIQRASKRSSNLSPLQVQLRVVLMNMPAAAPIFCAASLTSSRVRLLGNVEFVLPHALLGFYVQAVAFYTVRPLVQRRLVLVLDAVEERYGDVALATTSVRVS